MDTIISIYVLCFFARPGAVRALGKQAEGGDYGGQSDCDSVDAIGQASFQGVHLGSKFRTKLPQICLHCLILALLYRFGGSHALDYRVRC